jgi:Cu/Ag efflux protein CusF
MKTYLPKLFIPVLLGAGLVLGGIARADETGTASEHATARNANDRIHHYTGILRNIDTVSQAVRVKAFWSSRVFDVGNSCQISLQDKPDASLDDLKPGQRVDVSYKDYDGVRVATSVKQENMTVTGPVMAMDTTNRTFRIKSGWTSKQFTASPNCKVILRDETKHPFKELQIGQRVTVKYLTPESGNLAQSIEQKSLEYDGSVEALDARSDTVRAGDLFSHRTFRLGDECQIVVNGNLGGELSDLRIGDHLTFHYEDVDGVLVANRIELDSAHASPRAAQLSKKDSPSP